MRILLILVAMLSLLVVMASPEANPGAMPSGGSSAAPCELYASPSGGQRRAARPRGGRPGRKRRAGTGSPESPFQGAQRLVDALRPGQTGCLQGGVYGGELKFHHGGEPGHPITLRPVSGQRALLNGGPVWIPEGSDYVTIAGLRLAPVHTDQIGVQIMGQHAVLIGDDITNHSSRHSCVILGSNDGWGRAVDTVIEGTVIHQCGSRADGNQDHAIYFDNSSGAIVRDNVIWGTSGFAIHLYQHAVANAIIHNVIYDNGHGVIFAGSSELTSSANVVAYNIIGRTTRDYDVSSWWGGQVGSDNVVESNCLYNASHRMIERPGEGFRASGNVIARPGFVAAARRDYSLRPRSRCLRVVGYDIVPALRRLQDDV